MENKPCTPSQQARVDSDSAEETETLNQDLRRSGRKRRKVNYSDTERRTKKKRDMSGKQGFFPRGTEIPRSPKPGASGEDQGDFQGEMPPYVLDEAEGEVGTPSQAEQPVVHTLDSLANMIATVVTQNNTIVQKFEGVQHHLAHHTREIRRLDNRIEESEKRVSERIESLVDAKVADLRGQLGPTDTMASSTKQSREREAYWLARRSLRFAPVPERDLRAGMIKYVEDNLLIEPTVISSLPATAFRRPPTNRNSTIRKRS
jgi:hypothetical protein